MNYRITLLAALLLTPVRALCAETSQGAERDADTRTLRIFIFAGQSNMEGADSKVKDIKRFPPFAGLDMPQNQVLFSYNIGREEKLASKGWVSLQPVDGVVGPELSFARSVSQATKAPTDEKGLNAIDVTANLAAIPASDPAFIHLKAFNIPPQEEKLVITTAGIVRLGELLAQSYLEHR
jgi:hypothetical protein